MHPDQSALRQAMGAAPPLSVACRGYGIGFFVSTQAELTTVRTVPSRREAMFECEFAAWPATPNSWAVAKSIVLTVTDELLMESTFCWGVPSKWKDDVMSTVQTMSVYMAVPQSMVNAAGYAHDVRLCNFFHTD